MVQITFEIVTTGNGDIPGLNVRNCVVECRAIEARAPGRPVHFITHSLGGILLRSLLAEDPEMPAARVVMLAPPNSGSEIVDWSRSHPLIHRLLGPAGRALGSDGIPISLPPFPGRIEAAVIMGRRCTLPLFKHLLDDDNDGIVSAAKGRIEGLQRFTVIDADHTFIQVHPEAIRLSLKFLQSGEWDEERPTND
jgi:pimeloyl-ACP methyl ester carboxylesterase